MEQTKALNSLEPFLALAKSATSPAACADLISRATSAPNTFVFAELLDTPQIQAAAQDPTFSPHLQLLQIFSYGTLSDYLSHGTALPDLNDAQKLKLRQLSLLTLAKDNQTPPKSNLSYPLLRSALRLSSDDDDDDNRELEDLVISAIYAGLLGATLDPANGVVQVNSVAPLRDVPPLTSSAAAASGLGGLLSSLQSWAGRCESTLLSLETQMSQLRAAADRRASESAAWSAHMEQMLENERTSAEKKPTADSSHLSDRQGNSRLDIKSLLTSGNEGLSAGFAPGNYGNYLQGQQGSGLGQRFNKRGIKQLGNAGSSSSAGGGGGSRGDNLFGDIDNEDGMDVDSDNDGGGGTEGNGKKRASRRKL
ncbi:pci domain-protein [Diplogelasinospora grovesii]|uniref:Pci domain-protein n=1 Tax=Diplogelasinospora grovesii TaxID=303347 RepID=A0AAN6RZK9_9PEZI|nr:pci domain-protein [Diplogelasinospora grovesii]